MNQSYKGSNIKKKKTLGISLLTLFILTQQKRLWSRERGMIILAYTPIRWTHGGDTFPACFIVHILPIRVAEVSHFELKVANNLKNRERCVNTMFLCISKRMSESVYLNTWFYCIIK